MLNPSSFLLFSLLFTSLVALPLDFQKCTGEVEFYPDASDLFCIACRCAKGTNRPAKQYKTVKECEDHLPIVEGGCSGGADSTGLCDPEWMAGAFPPVKLRNGTVVNSQPRKCPTGSSCIMGMFGICCDAANEASWRENLAAKCAAGRKAVNVKGRMELFGKRCSDDFCPVPSACVQGKHLAYCCR